MAKPSIFSRDYEKRMKRRKRKIILSILVVVVVVIAIVAKFEINNIDFSNMRSKIQAWVDSDRPDDLNDDKKDSKKKADDNKANKDNEANKKKEKEEKKYVDLAVSDSLTVKAEYTEDNGAKKLVGVDEKTITDGTSYSINPSGSNILVTDSNQNILLFDVNGNKTDITKQSYTSQSGNVFAKDVVLAQNANYIWDSQARFIDDTTIAYVSQLPYFGDAAVNQYIWIYSIANSKDNCLWNNHGATVTLGDIVQDKGLSVNIDNVNYYVMNDGSVVQ